MTILALDLSGHMGWAVGRKGGFPAHGTMKLADGLADQGAANAACCDAIADLITDHAVTSIVVERQMEISHRTVKRWQNTTGLIELIGVARLVAWKRDVPIRFIPAITARAQTMGDGFPGKWGIMQWCRDQGWHPGTDHAADALLLLAYAQGVRAERRKAA